jgi:caffeoyl-CoA O-methyltransferase
MFVGYGAVAMLEGCPSSKVVSLEIDPYLKDWLSSCIESRPQISARHEIVVGPALESLPKLEGAFDMVFIDANKAEYKDYVKTILEKNLLAPDGMIVCDNILYNGYPYVDSHFDAQPARRGFGDAIKVFNQWVHDQPELEQIVLPIRDGVSFIRRRDLEQDASKAVTQQVTFAPEPRRSSESAEQCVESAPAAESAPVAADQSLAYVGRFEGSNSKHASPAMAAAAGQKGMHEDVTALPTCTKWSVLSSRVEGLVAELSQVVGKMDAYCVSKSNAEGPAMAAVRNKMVSTPWAEEWIAKRTMFSYGEEMSTDPLEAMLLKELVFLGKPQRVLEIGMFVGYGAVAMLEGWSTAKVVSLEIDPYLKDWLSSCLQDFPQISERHEIVVGPALESLPKLDGTFDMVFIDANKAEYKDYVQKILAENLLAPEGMIVCDNILYNGYPYVDGHFDAQPARRGFGDAIRGFNQWVYDHPELEQVVLPIRDGVSLIRRRQFAREPLDDATTAPSSADGASTKQTTPESDK